MTKEMEKKKIRLELASPETSDGKALFELLLQKKRKFIQDSHKPGKPSSLQEPDPLLNITDEQRLWILIYLFNEGFVEPRHSNAIINIYSKLRREYAHQAGISDHIIEKKEIQDPYLDFPSQNEIPFGIFLRKLVDTILWYEYCYRCDHQLWEEEP